MGLSPKASPRDSFLVFGSPLIEEPEIAEVVASLRSGWLGTGPKVAQFEKDFAAYKGVPHAVAVNSCTAALHVSMIAAGLKPGEEIALMDPFRETSKKKQESKAGAAASPMAGAPATTKQ